MTLPTGQVTFLFTDVEGSTRLLDALGDAFIDSLEAHNAILERAIRDHQGTVVNTEGDAYFAVFVDAADAARAAVQMVTGLDDHPWPPDGRFRVRIGMHTGQGVLGAHDYVGMDVHRAARISAAGHGSQVLMSADTHELIIGDLPAGTRTTDLGRHDLKDLPNPEHIYQLVLPDGPEKFPPLRVGATPPLPLPPLAVGVGTGWLASLSRGRLAALSAVGGLIVGIGAGVSLFSSDDCAVCLDEAQPATTVAAAETQPTTTTTTTAPPPTFSTTTTLVADTTTTTIPPSTIVGEWDFTVSITGVDGSVCDGEVGEVYVRTVVITGTDDDLSVDGMDNLEDPDDGPFLGTFEDGVLTFQGSRPEDDGVTHVLFEMTVDGDSMTGSETWSWDWTSQGETDTCVNGTSTVTATRTG